MDIQSISVAISSIKTAADLAKVLKDTSNEVEKAEMKLKLADIISNLADAKMEIATVQDVIQEKDQEIKRLTEVISQKDLLVKSGNAYYKKDKNGKQGTEPYCMRCWEVGQLQVSLIRFSGVGYRCPECDNKINARF